jgi:hypothetical protein
MGGKASKGPTYPTFLALDFYFLLEQV